MLCDVCKKNEATVHITKIVNGVKQEVNLCEKCAMEKGEFNFAPQIDFVSPFSFQNILGGIMDYVNNTGDTLVNSDIDCKNCGTSYSEFKKTGLLGCSDCYKNFSDIMYPLIKRVQANLEHTGKIPKRIGKDIIKKKNMIELKEKLQKAIALEEYEKAAQIRDKIKGLRNNINHEEE